MIGALIARAIRRPWFVLIGTIGACLLGVFAFVQLPIDAYPDIASQSVWVVTSYPGI